ncbi:hypothetical protein KQI65_07895 [bacterium]|nr:hypothetical protein [bacterium]
MSGFATRELVPLRVDSRLSGFATRELVPLRVDSRLSGFATRELVPLRVDSRLSGFATRELVPLRVDSRLSGFATLEFRFAERVSACRRAGVASPRWSSASRNAGAHPQLHRGFACRTK